MGRTQATGRRRAVALLAPLPVMAAVIGAYRMRWFDPFQEMPCAFPNVIMWHLLSSLGLRSMLASYVAVAGLWYFLMALGAYAALCGRDRVRPGLVMCLAATAVVMLAAAYLFRRMGVA